MADNEEEFDQNKEEEDLNQSNFDENSDMENSKCCEFNVILIGDSGVGKTSILAKFIEGNFENNKKCTIDVEFKTKNLKIDKDLYAKLTIFDTAGQERYRSLTKQYYHLAHGIVLVFDLTEENSFNSLNKWIKEIDDNTKNVEVMLVGNKSDLKNRAIINSKAEQFAHEKNFKYIETSAKEGTNVLLLFEELSNGMNKRKQNDSSIAEIGSLSTYIFKRAELNKELKNKKESKCCW
jgi:small GTP-binding protein